MTWIALALIAVGAAIRLWAMRAMKQAWSLVIQEPPQIVTTGPYRFVRHPSYVGSLMALFGVGLLSTLAAVMYLAVAFFLARAIQEEQGLTTHADYGEYRKRTGMFLPRLKG